MLKAQLDSAAKAGNAGQAVDIFNSLRDEEGDNGRMDGHVYNNVINAYGKKNDGLAASR